MTKSSFTYRCESSRLLSIVTWMLLLHPLSTAALPFDFAVIARMGDSNGFPGFKQEVSLNDRGQVAFAPYDWYHFPSYGSLWIGDGAAAPVFLDGSPSINYVQINNDGQVIAWKRAGVGARVTLYDSAKPTAVGITIAGTGSRMPPDYQEEMDAPSAVTINNLGVVAFYATISSPFSAPVPHILPHTSLFVTDPMLGLVRLGEVGHDAQNSVGPVIADDNRILVGPDNEGNPIRLFSLTGDPRALISSSMGFSKLGGKPGIVDAGNLIAFYGELSASGAASLTANQSKVFQPLTPGPGIFVGIEQGANWVVQRLAGISGNGQLDPGERFSDPEGKVDVGLLAEIYGFSRIPITALNGPVVRYAVAYHAKSGETGGLYLTAFTFDGTATAAGKAIVVDGPTRLVQTGDSIFRDDNGDGRYTEGKDTLLLPGKLKGFLLSDSLNRKGEVAFTVETDAGIEGVVRAMRSADLPDLVGNIGSGLVFPGGFGMGQAGTILLTVTNRGTARAIGTIAVDFYLSENFEFNPGQDTRIGRRSIVAVDLAPNGVTTIVAENVLIPNDPPPGGFVFLAIIDADAAIAESNEKNNVAISVRPGPDLQGTWVNYVFPDGFSPGASGRILVRIRNTGFGAALGSASVALYLSRDDSLGPSGDIPLNPVKLIPLDLQPGESVEVAFDSVQIPKDIEPGNYHLLGHVDDLDEVREQDERNNEIVGPSVKVAGVDLAATLTLAALDPSVLLMPSISSLSSVLTIQNLGSDRFVGSVPYTIYLSADTTLDSKDLRLTSDKQISLDLESKSSVSIDVTVILIAGPEPPLDRTGCRYLLVSLDDEKLISETSEANNIASTERFFMGGEVIHVITHGFNPRPPWLPVFGQPWSEFRMGWFEMRPPQQNLWVGGGSGSFPRL